MKPRIPALVTTLALLGLAGCSPAASGIVVSGTVDTGVDTVTAPTLGVTAVNLDAGFADQSGQTSPVTGRTANRTSTAAGKAGIGSTVRIAGVRVAEGDTVHAGQLLVTLDSSMQSAAVSAARADADVAAAGVGVLAAVIDDLGDKKADLEDARATARDGLRTLLSNRSKLLKARSQLSAARPGLAARLSSLVAKRAQVRAQHDQVAAQLAALEAQLPEHPELQPQVDQLRAVLAQLDDVLAKLGAGIRALTAGIARIDAGLARIRAALPKIAKGLAKVRAGLRRINDGLDKVADLRGNLSDQKEVLALQARALKVPIEAARVQLSLTRLTSPVDGVVVSVAAVGEQLAPGATVAGIRESGPSTVTAWLSPSQLGRICPGDAARVRGDWMDGDGVPATLTRISTSADYPPTSVATDEVHLTRAVEVQFTATEQLPAGVPVEVSIQPCHAAGTNPSR
jgi:multidrug resistance efflux pump